MQTAKEIMPKMMSEMTASYDKYFTEQEIKEFIVFYKTPAGRKYISVMPEMMKDMMGNMMKTYIPEMQKTMKVRMEEYIKKEKK